MRGGLLFLGILLLLVGAALYFLVPGVDANVRYARDAADDQLTMGILPFIGLVAMALGALIALLGLIIPGSRHHDHHDDHDHAVERTKTVVKDTRGRVKRVETTEVRREE